MIIWWYYCVSQPREETNYISTEIVYEFMVKLLFLFHFEKSKTSHFWHNRVCVCYEWWSRLKHTPSVTELFENRVQVEPESLDSVVLLRLRVKPPPPLFPETKQSLLLLIGFLLFPFQMINCIIHLHVKRKTTRMNKFVDLGARSQSWTKTNQVGTFVGQQKTFLARGKGRACEDVQPCWMEPSGSPSWRIELGQFNLLDKPHSLELIELVVEPSHVVLYIIDRYGTHILNWNNIWVWKPLPFSEHTHFQIWFVWWQIFAIQVMFFGNH